MHLVLYTYVLIYGFFSVTKAEKVNLSRNPANLLDRCDFCDNPHPRFYKYNKKPDAHPKDKYLAYNECLPGCIGSPNVTKKTIHLVPGSTEQINITNYLSCKPYDGSNKRQIQGNPLGKGKKILIGLLD